MENFTDRVYKSKGGRPRIFETPEDLEKTFNEYLEFMKTQTWKKQEFIKSGEFAGKIIELETQRPLTMESFCLFANINSKYLYQLNEDTKQKFSNIVTRIHETLREQKVSGAMVGAYNSNLVARLEGITDKHDITSNGDSISLNVNVSNPGLSKDLDKE